jgi:hypothetical protein
VGISVSELVAGSDAVLVYDGTGVSDVRSTTVAGLVTDMTYAFKVAAINAVGEGVLSGPSTTVVASSGASATYTTAVGSSLSVGITGYVPEEQIVHFPAVCDLSTSATACPWWESSPLQ